MHKIHLEKSAFTLTISGSYWLLTVLVEEDWNQFIHVFKKPHVLGRVVFDEREYNLHEPTASLGTGNGLAWSNRPGHLVTRGE